MAAEVLTAAFVDELEKHRILGPGQISEARNLAGSDTDPKSLAGQLIHRGWLTPFQVNRVLQGRGESLALGHYVLLDRLGQGGMGEVFRARHALMDRIVALKVIRGDHLDKPDCLARFRREMQAAAKLAHPNVVLAHDAALAGDVYFLAMEYVEGADLGRLVKKRGKLPPAEACNYIRQAAMGLQHAHERGLVHRDIKPSNLIVATPGDVVKILDLGLARLCMDLEIYATAAGLTPEGSVMGTPDYLAPEQAVDARTADIRADIYSLGCTLYHLLTGQPPFPGGSFTEKLLRHQQAEPEALEHLCPDASAGLARVVRRMMAKRPHDRYQTPQEVADALAPYAAAATEPGVVPRVAAAEAETVTDGWAAQATRTMPPAEKPRPPSRRAPLIVLGALAVGLVLAFAMVIIVPVIFLLLWTGSAPVTEERGEHGPTAGVQPAGVPDPKVAAIPDPKADGVADPKVGGVPIPKGFGVPIHKGGGVTIPKGFGVPIPKGGGSPEPKPAEPPAGGTREVKSLAKIAADGPAKLIADLKGHTGTLQCFAFSADGTQLASGADDRQTRLWDGRTGEEQGTPLRHGEAVRALAFSPDGKQLATASYGGGYEGAVKLWDLAGDEKPVTLPWKDKTGTPSLAQVNGLAYSPDGKKLAAGGGPLRIWDLSKVGEPNVHIWQKTIPSYIHSVAFAPDGKSVAAGCHEQGDSVRVWTIGPQDEPTFLQGKTQAFGLSHSDVRGVVAYAAGGKLLVRVTSEGAGGFQKPAGTVMLWDVDPAKQRITLRDTLKIPGGAVFALVGDASGHLRVAVTAGNPGIGGGGLAPKPPAGEVNIWDAATGKVRTLETGHKESITTLAFSPDGARLATGSIDQVAKLWDLTR